MPLAESVACATDGYVFQGLYREQFPEIAATLEKFGTLPETYVQKWYEQACAALWVCAHYSTQVSNP